MAEDIYMPKLGMTMSEGTVLQWLMPDGGEVVQSVPVVSIESDKITYEVEAPISGTLRIIAPEGKVCAVGEVIGRIE